MTGSLTSRNPNRLDDAYQVATQLVTVGALTSSVAQLDDQDTTRLVADTLTSGSHPHSNMPGRRREDDTNIVEAFNWQGDTNQGTDLGLTDQPSLTKSTSWAIAENQRGELLETDYAHQLTSGGGKPGQGYAAARTPQGVRRLTPVECERLQGFPDDWTAIDGEATPDSRRYAAMGDAVTTNVAEWIGHRLMNLERLEP